MPPPPSRAQYDQSTALQIDNGIFWIDFDSVIKNFASVYFNWNPELFRYKQVRVCRQPLATLSELADVVVCVHRGVKASSCVVFLVRLLVDAPSQQSSARGSFVPSAPPMSWVPLPQITHGAWPLSAPGPVRDRITLGDNPQYRLAVTVPASPAGSTSAVWAVLTRHVTEKEEDDEDEEGGRKPDGGDDAASDRKDYLALHVFKGKGDAAASGVCVCGIRACHLFPVARGGCGSGVGSGVCAAHPRGDAAHTMSSVSLQALVLSSV